MLKKLIGKTIVECREAGAGFVMKLDSGEKVTVTVSLDGGPGADGEWYQWGVLCVDGERVGDRA